MIAPSSNVQSLMEMGFPRQAVEQAVKALAGIGNLNPSPESIVGWLLEHPGYKDDDKEILDEATEESSEVSYLFTLFVYFLSLFVYFCVIFSCLFTNCWQLFTFC